ncbi:MAG: hypothetical protein NVSMB46_00090 [Candidatus Saccharimonadales bacterium]
MENEPVIESVNETHPVTLENILQGEIEDVPQDNLKPINRGYYLPLRFFKED